MWGACGRVAWLARCMRMLVLSLALSLSFPSRGLGSDVVGAPVLRRVHGDLFWVGTDLDEASCERYRELFDECVELGEAVSRDAVMPWFARIPMRDVERMVELGWHVSVGHGDGFVERACGAEGDVLGMCVPAQRTLFVEDSDDGLRLGLLHEVGHFVDWSRGGLARRDAFWQSLFLAEAETFSDPGRLDGYAATDVAEFFAEIYRCGVAYPATTRLSAPRAYLYVFGDVRGR